MAGSLAFDATSCSTPGTSRACAASYPGGPQGVFLKRVTDAKGASRLVYAKASLYPAARRALRAACSASTAGCCS